MDDIIKKSTTMSNKEKKDISVAHHYLSGK